MEVIEENYRKVMDKPLRVLDIFNEFFGEDKVDMQGFPTLDEVKKILPSDASTERIATYILSRTSDRHRTFILVHFPTVKITNEYDRSVIINHLYAKVEIDLAGKLLNRFTLNRSDYTMLHLMNNYMHSHISCIPFEDLTVFQLPCTGTGPINNTICSLIRDFDEDLWKLFCLELDKYVHVESIAGTPYHRLESLRIGGSSSCVACGYMCFTNSIGSTVFGRRGSLTFANLAEFIKYIIDNDILRFNFNNGAYYLAMSTTQFFIRMSNAFIDWYNKEQPKGTLQINSLQDLIATGFLKSYKFSNGKLYSPGRNTPEYYLPYIGRKVCDFKGKPVLFTISDAPQTEEQDNNVLILDEFTADYILTKILNVLNFRYGSNRNQEDNTPREKVCFV